MNNNGRMLGVIGGSGFYTFFESDIRNIEVDTPYGDPSAPVTVGTVGEHEVAFLPRHGATHQFSAHTVPYRANMWALRKLGVRRVFGPCAVGSLDPEIGPGAVVVPDQLVDRTTGRITQLKLPDFDPYYSDVSWYRDYAAYCGVADDGNRVSALVVQITTKKPLYKKTLEKLGGEFPNAVCEAPLWQRSPARVVFSPLGGDQLSVDINGRFADVTPDSPGEE